MNPPDRETGNPPEGWESAGEFKGKETGARSQKTEDRWQQAADSSQQTENN